MNHVPPLPPGAPPPIPGTTPKTDSMATASLVLGILSITFFACFTGFPAVICGHIARGRIARSGGQLGGGGLATAGLSMGYLAIVGSVIIAAAGVVLFKKAPVLQSSAAQPIVATQANQLATALQQYRRTNGHLPILPATNGEQVDATKLTAILTGQNPKGPAYYSPNQGGLELNGAPSDLWLQPLNIAIDLDNDGFVQVGKHKVAGTVAVWSSGPNKTNERGDGDDVRSW